MKQTKKITIGVYRLHPYWSIGMTALDEKGKGQTASLDAGARTSMIHKARKITGILQSAGVEAEFFAEDES
jgi:hypothetical protein